MTPTTRTLRLVAVTGALQSLAATACVGAMQGVGAAVAGASGRADRGARVVAAVEAAAWAGLALCCCWFALAVLACARDLARHPTRPLPGPAEGCLRPPLVRSLLVVLVGGCLATPAPLPVSDQDWSVLDGLPVPDLPLGVGPTEGSAARPWRPARREQADRTVVLRSGDCLWSVTTALLGPRASDRAVARAWPALHRANRVLIGPDPDLVLPGARLRVPAALIAPQDRPQHEHRAGAAR